MTGLPVTGQWAGNLYLADRGGYPAAVGRLDGTIMIVSGEGDGTKAGPIIGRMFLHGDLWWAWTARRPEMTTTDRQVAVRVSLDEGLTAILDACHGCGQPAASQRPARRVSGARNPEPTPHRNGNA